MNFIQNMEPYWEGYRFLMVPFEIPALVAMKIMPDIEPVSIARLYFYTLYIPFILCLSCLFLRLKKENEIFIAALIFFVVFLPGMNFQLSHINETLVIFILSVLCAYRQKLIPFILLSSLAASGHPAILVPFIVLLLFLSADVFYFKKSEFRKYFIVTFIMALLLIIKVSITLSQNSSLSESYIATVLTHFSELNLSKNDFISVSYLLALSILVECVPALRKITQIVWSVCIFIMIFLISRHKDFELFHQIYQYRVFATLFFCLIMFYIWSVTRLKVKPVNSLLSSIFITILASWFTFREIKSTMKFRKDAPEMIKHESVSGCNHTDRKGIYLHTALPIVKIFFENKRTVENILYSVKYDPEKRLCGALNENSFPMYNGQDKIYSIPIRSKGFFTILPMNKKN